MGAKCAWETDPQGSLEQEISCGKHNVLGFCEEAYGYPHPACGRWSGVVCDTPEPQPLQGTGSCMWLSLMPERMTGDQLNSLYVSEAEIEPENMREKCFRSLAGILENKNSKTDFTALFKN